MLIPDYTHTIKNTNQSRVVEVMGMTVSSVAAIKQAFRKQLKTEKISSNLLYLSR